MELDKIAIFGMLSALISATYGMSAGYAFSSLEGEIGGIYWFLLVFFVPFVISLCLYTLLSYNVSSHHYQTAFAVFFVSNLLSFSTIYLVTEYIPVNLVLFFEMVLTLVALFVGTLSGSKLRMIKNA
ncbi:hypothetical protein [Microbulbifer agarilyticus]